MKVCAHVNLSPFQHVHWRSDSVDSAVRHFRNLLSTHYGSLEGIPERTGEDRIPTLMYYPQCFDCNSHMNFHDYPAGAFRVGNRGGIRRVSV